MIRTPEQIQDVLLHNWSKDRAASFYIVRSRSREHLSRWMEDFSTRFLSQHLRLHPSKARQRFRQGHPDLLYLSPPKDGHYKMEEKHLQDLVRGQYFRPMELPRKIFIVADAHKIRNDYASKLLKTLEEPHPLSSIFFLSPNSRPLLSTIESRSILLRLPPAEQPDAEPSPEELLLSPIIDPILEQCEDYETLNNLQQELAWYETSSTFHNNVQARLFGLNNL